MPLYIRPVTRVFPVNTARAPCAGTMLGQRRRQRTSIVPAQGARAVFTG